MPAPASGIRAAKRAIVDAQDELEAAKEALAQLKADLPAWEQALREADIALEAAISTVLAPHVRELLDKARKIKDEWAPVRSVLLALFNDEPSKAPTHDYWAAEKGQKPLAAIRTEVAEFLRTFDMFGVQQSDPWRPARRLLRNDPYASLPDFTSAAMGAAA